jgi:hypothetical protein
MTARFAGSRSLDERRRRWLATNETDQLPDLASQKPSQTSEEESPSREVQLGQFPIRKVISPKAWKIAGVIVLVGLFGFLIVLAGAAGWPDAESLGPGCHRLIDSRGGSLARLFQAGLLMLSGQLALLIWWGRSQSLRDFDGQYRIWLWAAVILVFAGWGLVGDWHWAWSDTICWLWSARFPQREVVCWALPSVVLAGLLGRKLSADIRPCKCSFFLLWLAGLAFAAACVFRLGIDRTGWPSATKQLAGASLRMLACVGIFASLLTHARYVIHISAEPPELRPSVWSKLFRVITLLFQKLPKPRLSALMKFRQLPKKPDEKPTKTPQRSGKQTAQGSSPDIPAEAATPRESSPKTKPRKPLGRKITSPDQQEPEKPVPPSKPESAPTQAAKQTANGGLSSTEEEPNPAAVEVHTPPITSVRDPKQPTTRTQPVPAAVQPASIDAEEEPDDDANEPQLRLDPLDPNQLKGLSKKQRRQLRKQHRDNQRQG